MKKTIRVLFLCILSVPAFAQNRHTIYTGADLFKAFGNQTGVLDSTTWSPNSAVEQSLKITYAGVYGTYAFRGISADQSLAPAGVDWSAGDLTFDYKTTQLSSVYVIRLFILSGVTDIRVVDYVGPLALTADGNWHTATVPVSDWYADYYTAVGNATLNPTVPQQFRIFIQNAGTFGDINIDNVQVPLAANVVAPVGVDVAIAGADVQLTFDSVDGQSYQLHVSTDDMASFAPVAGATGTGDGNPLTLTHTGGVPSSGSRVFYHIETN